MKEGNLSLITMGNIGLEQTEKASTTAIILLLRDNPVSQHKLLNSQFEISSKSGWIKSTAK